MANKYVDVIANNIKDERCVLMLGPELWVDEEGKALQPELQSFLEKETDTKIDYDINNLYHFETKSTKTFLYSDLRKFYDRHRKPSELHRKIAQIPFHLIITAHPNLLIRNALDELGMRHDFHFYNKKQNPKDVDKPSKERPLVYNFFGSIEEEDSLILTSDDLFDFLFSVLGSEQRLPRELKNILQNTKTFLFLGFDFHNWYLKLILRLFDLHKDILPISNDFDLEKRYQDFYLDNFEMQFIEDKTPDFISDLFDVFEKDASLKEISTSSEDPIIDKIRDFIREDQTEDALIELEDYLEDKSEDLLNTVIQQSGMYNRLQRQISKKTISREDADLELNQINDAIISIAEQIKNL